MKTTYKSRIISFATAAFFTMACLSQVLIKNVYATSNEQELLITEVMPMSQSENDSYEYFELYNNSDRNIDLKNYKLPLQNMDITTSKVIAPKGILVVCTKGNTTLSDFNTFYNTKLTSSKYITLPFVDEVLSNDSTTSILITKDDDTEIVRAQYDTEDFQVKKGVTYKYTDTGFDMMKLGQNQSPTPGSVSLEQVQQSGTSVTGITLDESYITMEINETAVLCATVAPSTATNKSIVWTSKNSSIVEVSQKGVLTAKAAGTANIVATTVDGGKTATCTVVVSKIPVTGITLNKTSITMDINQTATLYATIAPSTATNKSIVWASSDSSIVGVSQKGILTSKEEGTAKVTATTVDGGKVATCIVVVRNVPVTGITLNKTSITMALNETVTLYATITPTTATNKAIVWTSRNSDIVEVSQKGTLKAKAEGTVRVLATTVDGGKVASCTVIVSKVPVTGITLNKTSITMDINQTTTLYATITPATATNKDIVWISGNSSIVEVSQKGVLTAKSDGTVKVIAATVDGGKIAECTVVVRKTSATGITLDKTSSLIEVGESIILKASVTPANASNKLLNWSSSNSNIASVDSTGKVVGKAAGEAIITVTIKDSSVKDTCIITVKDDKDTDNEIFSIRLNKTSIQIKEGKFEKLTPIITPGNLKKTCLIWKSSDEKIAYVTQDGRVFARKEGTVVITVTTKDGAKATCKVQIISGKDNEKEKGHGKGHGKGNGKGHFK